MVGAGHFPIIFNSENVLAEQRVVYIILLS